MTGGQVAPVRLAVVGGHRGRSFDQTLAVLSGRAELVAACDVDAEVLAAWQRDHRDARCYADYVDLLADDAVDAVLLATPLAVHAAQAVAALEAGKHVLSEVIAADTLDGCWALVDAVERTGRTYMMAENYCFSRPNLMVENLAARGCFGRVVHLEGAYLHDCRSLLHRPGGELTWRGEARRDFAGVIYPTHSLGPLARWLRAANGPDDRLDTLTACMSASPSVRRFVAEQFGPEHYGADGDERWRQGDSGSVLIRSSGGAVLDLRVDWVSARPHDMTHYGLQGTHGAYLTGRYEGEDPLVWLEGRSPGRSEGLAGQQPAQWEPLWRYAEEFEHPLWRRWPDTARRTGHGGGDFFVVDEFVRAIQEQRPPAVDVYDAATWSSVAPLSAQSIAAGGAPVRIPDFRAGQRGH